jgi:predicted dinucleotide-binding enzyme
VFLCGENAAVKSAVKTLAEDLGVIGIDRGTLERAQLVEATADLIRFLIAGMGLGPFRSACTSNGLPIE